MKKNLKYSFGLLAIMLLGMATSSFAGTVCDGSKMSNNSCRCLQVDLYLPVGSWLITPQINEGSKDGDSAPVNPTSIQGGNTQPYSYGFWQPNVAPDGVNIQLALQKSSDNGNITVAVISAKQGRCYAEAQHVSASTLFIDPNYTSTNIVKNGSYSDNKPGQVTLTISSN